MLTKEEDISSGDFTKDKNGQTLQGTEESPYEINCIEDILNLSVQSSGSNAWKYLGKYYILTRTLDFKSMSSYQDFTTTEYGDINGDGATEILLKELTTEKGFSPIVNFMGTFNGQGYELRNLYENKEGVAGLFECLNGGIISHLGLTGSIKGTNTAGGFAVLGSGKARIEGCYFKGKVEGKTFVGGICGDGESTDFIIDKCYNEGEIISEDSAGGIVGLAFGNIVKNSYNKGYVYGKSNAGGISGNTNKTPHIYNSFNYGYIKSDSRAGGLVGWIINNIRVKNVYNIGKVECSNNAGGIAGVAGWNNPDILIENSFYLEGTATKGTNNCTDTTTVYNEQVMKSEAFVKELNDYITNNSETTEGWLKWKQIKDGYPIFE